MTSPSRLERFSLALATRFLAPLAAGVVLLLLVNFGVGVVTLAVLKNDVAHNTARIERIEAKVDRIILYQLEKE